MDVGSSRPRRAAPAPCSCCGQHCPARRPAPPAYLHHALDVLVEVHLAVQKLFGGVCVLEAQLHVFLLAPHKHVDQAAESLGVQKLDLRTHAELEEGPRGFRFWAAGGRVESKGTSKALAFQSLDLRVGTA
eukprot:354954-Chlamydomonas_euryale.AAC.4